MNFQVNQATSVEITAELVPDPGVSMEDAVEKAKALGNEILSVDYKNRTIKVAHEIRLIKE